MTFFYEVELRSYCFAVYINIRHTFSQC